MPYGWEGNRRSSIALAMRHKVNRFTHLRATSHDLKKIALCGSASIPLRGARLT